MMAVLARARRSAAQERERRWLGSGVEKREERKGSSRGEERVVEGVGGDGERGRERETTA